MAISNKLLSEYKVYKLFVLVAILSIIVNCKNDSQINKNKFYNIDLAIKYKKQVNSFMIETDGRILVIIKEIYKPDKYYKVIFNDSEMNYIQRVLKKIDFSKCDTINQNVTDGIQYVLYLENKEDKRRVIGGTCEQQKPLDELVKFIDKTFKRKKKKNLFNGLNLIIPPNPPSK
jgi:hypothetical protein